MSADTPASSGLSYLIVGAGVFGTSTALHLISRYPGASVTLLDRDDASAASFSPATPRVAASWDWNKAVRADYGDPAYCELGLEAQAAWRGKGPVPSSSSPSSPDSEQQLWKPFYRESGIFWISRGDIADRVVANLDARWAQGAPPGEEGGDHHGAEAIPVERARGLYGGIFDQADYAGVGKVLVNRGSGWADAKGALAAATARAVGLGVRFVAAEVETLLFEGGEGDGQQRQRCCGVQTRDGRELRADRVILSTGAYTPRLLDQSASRSGIAGLRAGGRIVPAAVTTGLTRLGDEDMARFRGMPVGTQENPPGRGASNGSLPPTDDNELKWWGQMVLKNTQTSPSGSVYSSPPDRPDYAQWDVPDSLKEDIRIANTSTFGKQGEHWKLEKFRLCWDAITPTEDFIISPHPAAGNLYVATVGSFHGFKFLPIIGKYVVQMLEGSLSSTWQKKWAWDKGEQEDPSLKKWWPQYELRDFV